MTTRSKVILVVHKVLLRIAGTRLGGLWTVGYAAAARAWAGYLLWGERGGTAYARGSLGGSDLLPGLSDIDLAIVLRGDAGDPGRAATRVRARWLRLRRLVRLSDLLLDYPMIFERAELAEAVDSSTFSYGAAAYQGNHANPDVVRLLERPGLYSASTDWRRLTGTDQRPVEHERDDQTRRIAAWLELCAWWQFVFPACVDPSGPRTSSLCVKLVAEPLRIWLWLTEGEREGSRADVLRRGLRLMPDQEAAFRHALALLEELPRSPAPPLGEALTTLIEMSSRIEALIGAAIAPAGTTEVRLAGARADELIPAYRVRSWVESPWATERPRPLPLCDFRSLTDPGLLDESFVVLAGDPADPAVLAAACAAQDYGPIPALRTDGLMLFPAGIRARTRVRAVKSTATDPVSFAVLAGREEATFPNVSGLSARDTAARALAEHRAWLATARGTSDADDERGHRLSMLLSAARVALFAESLEDREPELAVTSTEIARQLGSRFPDLLNVADGALEAHREFAIRRTAPDHSTLAATRALVMRLPSYAGSGSKASVAS